MKSEFFGTAFCRGEVIRYYLLYGAGRYGVGVEYRNERVLLAGLTGLRTQAESLLEAMLRGSVTPVTVRDVAEDWLNAERL